MTAEERAKYWKEFSDIYQRKYEEAREKIIELEKENERLEDRKDIYLDRWHEEKVKRLKLEEENEKLKTENKPSINEYGEEVIPVTFDSEDVVDIIYGLRELVSWEKIKLKTKYPIPQKTKSEMIKIREERIRDYSKTLIKTEKKFKEETRKHNQFITIL